MKSGNLNFLETSGPLQACNGTALPLPLCCGRIKRLRVSISSWLDLNLHDFSHTLPEEVVYYLRICPGLYCSWFFRVLADGQRSDTLKQIVTTSFHIQWNFVGQAAALRCEGFPTSGELVLSHSSGWFDSTKPTTSYPTLRCVYFHSASRRMECDLSGYLCLPTYLSTLYILFSGNGVGN